MEALYPTSSKVGEGHLDFSKANTSDLEMAQIGILFRNLEANLPNAVTAAQSYLASVQDGQDSLANTSWQAVQNEVQASNTYWQNNPEGNWAASSGADVTLAALQSSAGAPYAGNSVSNTQGQKVQLLA